MAFSVTESGVTMKTGRGKNAVAITLDFKRIEAWAKKMKIDEARLWRIGYARACSGLKKKFAQVMANAGGMLGVPKFKDFEEFTKQLRAIDGKSDRPMGGVLADKRRIVAYKRNGYQVIGWPDSMRDLAIAFQEGRGITANDESHLSDISVRRALHRRGIRDIPRAYVHNPRSVIPDPFCDFVKSHLDEWARGAYYKELARQMAKNGDFR